MGCRLSAPRQDEIVQSMSIGPLLRQLRKDVGRSQSEQAAMLSDLAGRAVTRNEVSRWESEARLLTPYWQAHVALSFNVPVATLRRAVAATKAQRRLRRSKEAPEGGDMERRDFLGAAAGLALSSLPLFEVAHAGNRIGMSDVQQLMARTARLRRLDNFLGGGETYRLYANELAATVRLTRTTSLTAQTRQACTAVIAEQAQLVGWAAFDAGMHREAKQHYLTSFDAAKEARNTALAGNALAFLAYQEVSVRRPSVEMAAASYATARAGATPRVKALLLERLAWTHAVAGQAQETDRALQQAQEALQIPDDRPEPDWVFWVDAREIQIMSGRCWTELQRPLRAVPTLEAALYSYDDTHARDKSLYLTWLARAYSDAGEIEQAAQVLGRSIALARGVDSIRPRERILPMLHRLQPHQEVPEVAAVYEAASTLSQ